MTELGVLFYIIQDIFSENDLNYFLNHMVRLKKRVFQVVTKRERERINLKRVTVKSKKYKMVTQMMIIMRPCFLYWKYMENLHNSNKTFCKIIFGL